MAGQTGKWMGQNIEWEKQQAGMNYIIDYLRAMREGQDLLTSQMNDKMESLASQNKALAGQVQLLTKKVELLSKPVLSDLENNDALSDVVEDVSIDVSDQSDVMQATAPVENALDASAPPSYEKVTGNIRKEQEHQPAGARALGQGASNAGAISFSSFLASSDLAAPYLAAEKMKPWTSSATQYIKGDDWYKEGVIVEIKKYYELQDKVEKVHPSHFSKTTLRFTQTDIGEFQVADGDTRGPIWKLVFENLLQLQYKGVSRTEGVSVVFNVKPLICFINKKFYG